MFGQFQWPSYGPKIQDDELFQNTFGASGENISPITSTPSPIMQAPESSSTPQNITGGGAAPAVQQPQIPAMQMGGGPTVIKKGGKSPQPQGGGIGIGGIPGLSSIMKGIPGMGGGGGGLFGGGAASGAGAGGGGGLFGGGGGGMLSSLFSNPWTAIPAAAVVGAGSLSADSASAGTGANVENWLGPLYNIPEAISRGNWDDVMKDGALGPIGALYGIFSGKDALKSIANSFGPAGQIPYLIGKGQMPYSGGKTSKNFMSAFQGRGV